LRFYAFCLQRYFSASPERINLKFSEALPERVVFGSFWNEVLKLYTEDSMTDDRGGGPVANGTQDFRKGQPYEAGLSFIHVRTSVRGRDNPHSYRVSSFHFHFFFSN
jgi:hypothetical protein